MCADAHLSNNEHSALVAATETSYLRLARNQAHPGYCVVILREHVTDLAALPSPTLTSLWADIQRAAVAIDRVFRPKKLDYLVMGHRMPHVHCHLLPQHATDDPLRNVDIADGPSYPSAAVFRASVAALATAWRDAASI